MIKLRLVGGPWDGEITDLNGVKAVLQLPETEYTIEGFRDKNWHTYSIKAIKGPDVVFYVGVHSTLSLAQGMEKLFYETCEDREANRRTNGQEDSRYRF
jgi:hypothetical protein